jgi:hypothetical protein
MGLAGMRAVVTPSFLPKTHKNQGFCPHGSKNGRTDGKMLAWAERLPAWNARLPARIGKSPHEMENGRTDGEIAARN